MCSTDISLADEMLTDFKLFRQTLKKQNVTFGEIMEKSTVALLKAESSHSLESRNQEPNSNVCFNYKLNILNVLGEILQGAALLSENEDKVETLERNHLYALREYTGQLHANTRKLMVTVDSMEQMRDCLIEQHNQNN